MQQPFSCVPHTYHGIESTLSAARLGRFLLAANGDRHLALRYYVWNAELCEALYLPVHLAEVAIRNSIHRALQNRYGADWHTVGAFLCTLPKRIIEELDEAQRVERDQHGSRMSIDHIVSAMSFGFWVHLTTKNYAHLIWKGSLRTAFPHLPRDTKLYEVHDALESIRRLRNRLAHHNAVFDKQPMSHFQGIQKVVGWICPETRWLLDELNTVSRVINMRPQH